MLSFEEMGMIDLKKKFDECIKGYGSKTNELHWNTELNHSPAVSLSNDGFIPVSSFLENGFLKYFLKYWLYISVMCKRRAFLQHIAKIPSVFASHNIFYLGNLHMCWQIWTILSSYSLTISWHLQPFHRLLTKWFRSWTGCDTCSRKVNNLSLCVMHS